MEIKKVVGINIMIISIIFFAYGLGLMLIWGGLKLYIAVFAAIIIATVIACWKKKKEISIMGIVASILMLVMYFGKIYCVIYVYPIIILISILYKIIIARKIDKKQNGIIAYNILVYVIFLPSEILALMLFIIFFKMNIELISF